MFTQETASRDKCIGWVFLIGGILMIVVHSWRWYASSGSEEWPTVAGRLTMSMVTESRERRGSSNTYVLAYHPHIKYQYTVDNEPFEADRISFVRQRYTKESAHAFVNRHPVGSKIKVFYNPSVPSRATLIPGGTDYAFYWVLFSIAITGFGAFTLHRLKKPGLR